MEFNKVRELLDRYWDGTSTLEEEEALRSFFSRENADLPADLKEAQPLFRYFAAEEEIPMPVFPDIEIPVVGTPEKPVRQMIWQHWMKYAAMLLVAVGIGYALQQARSRQEGITAALSAEQDTFDDPEKAFAATQKALKLLSRNLNKGTAQMQKLAYFNEATEKLKTN
ncbi:hypothetical protein L3C95_15260 [Chitinophaga filiformis]|uniref:hypothetical protein n=1 Tax=Chitinophaga filiformis TaxID=104663 RepID=UPI001F2D3575|nr:hypothetical protein [Chitinophaga filiformis]MCF6404253.1 hypothetical protein [Chitinophaga filiformis]